MPTTTSIPPSFFSPSALHILSFCSSASFALHPRQIRQRYATQRYTRISVIRRSPLPPFSSFFYSPRITFLSLCLSCVGFASNYPNQYSADSFPLLLARPPPNHQPSKSIDSTHQIHTIDCTGLDPDFLLSTPPSIRPSIYVSTAQPFHPHPTLPRQPPIHPQPHRTDLTETRTNWNLSKYNGIWLQIDLVLLAYTIIQPRNARP